ncbi:hypothetical protein [Sphingomonas sp. LR55]|uniref:hypothetical protein n=1 Tax=Sphingomonas sp. LR55 TaxID=3050231 RepID=UPI002FE40D7E
MKTMVLIAMLALPLLSGCGKKDDPTDTLAASNFTPPQTRADTDPWPGTDHADHRLCREIPA